MRTFAGTYEKCLRLVDSPDQNSIQWHRECNSLIVGCHLWLDTGLWRSLQVDTEAAHFFKSLIVLSGCQGHLKIRQMEETKICPYCGEEILAVAKKCKHCGEWLKEDVSDTGNVLLLKDENKLYCRHCNQPISIDADVCPHCGNNDPFFFAAIKKEEKTYKESWGLLLLIAVAVEIGFRIFTDHSGFLNWRFPQAAAYILLCVIVLLGFWAIRKSLREEHEKEMTVTFTKVGDEKAIDRWKNRVKQIID